MDDEAAIIKNIAADPTEVAFLIYADWLEERACPCADKSRQVAKWPKESRQRVAKRLSDHGRTVAFTKPGDALTVMMGRFPVVISGIGQRERGLQRTREAILRFGELFRPLTIPQLTITPLPPLPRMPKDPIIRRYVERMRKTGD